MSTAIAFRENTAPVPDTPANRRELIDELRQYEQLLNVRYRLQTYGEALQSLNQQAERAQYYLLQLNTLENSLTVTGYSARDSVKADQKYEELERLARDIPEVDVVLVSVDSLAALERAYPNYFADTRIFVELLTQELTDTQHDISPPTPILEGASEK